MKSKVILGLVALVGTFFVSIPEAQANEFPTIESFTMTPNSIELTSGNTTVSDEKYKLVTGTYASGTFTVSSSGTDTLVIYDGDDSSGVSQTAVVLKGITTSTLTDNGYGTITYGTSSGGSGDTGGGTTTPTEAMSMTAATSTPESCRRTASR